MMEIKPWEERQTTILGNECHRAMEAEIAELRAAFRNYKKDAERYRWLREYRVYSYIACGKMDVLDGELDSAIDAKEGVK